MACALLVGICACSVQDKDKIVVMIESGAWKIAFVRKLSCSESTLKNMKRNLEETVVFYEWERRKSYITFSGVNDQQKESL